MNGSGHTPPVRGPGNTDPPDNAVSPPSEAPPGEFPYTLDLRAGAITFTGLRRAVAGTGVQGVIARQYLISPH